MGKSTTASLFRGIGISVFDADQCVRELYSGDAFLMLSARFPEAVSDRGIDRNILLRTIMANPSAITDLESILHPLVAAKRYEFLEQKRKDGARIAVVDVPLLFESRAWRDIDAIVVVSAPLPIQLERVLARPGMDRKKFDTLVARQIPDEEKRRRAHFVVHSEFGLDSARRQVETIIGAVGQVEC